MCKTAAEAAASMGDELLRSSEYFPGPWSADLAFGYSDAKSSRSNNAQGSFLSLAPSSYNVKLAKISGIGPGIAFTHWLSLQISTYPNPAS